MWIQKKCVPLRRLRKQIMENRIVISNPSEKLISLVKKLRDMKVAQRMEMRNSSMQAISISL